MKMWKLLPLYVIVVAGALSLVLWSNDAVTVLIETAPISNRSCIVIDAGHGGIDGGATSCTGVLESQLNLEISLRLRDLMGILGYETIMIRTTDTSVYTEGNTIASQKVSDLKQRVKIVNSTPNSILVSIHQNTFADSQYFGPQVFYANDDASKMLAQSIQTELNQHLAPNSERKTKSSHGIYLMQNIQSPGVLIECGFISNPQEEANLRNEEYQKYLTSVIGICLSNYLEQQNSRLP